MDFSRKAARERFSKKIAPQVFAELEPPHHRFALAHFDTTSAAAAKVALEFFDDGLAGDDDIVLAPLIRLSLARAVKALDSKAALAIAAPIADGKVRAVWLFGANRVDVIDVRLDPVALREAQREVREHARADAEGVTPAEETKPKLIVVGSWRDPNVYLPSPLPKGWKLRGNALGGVQKLAVGTSLLVEIGAADAPDGEMVLVWIAMAKTDRLPSPVEASRVLRKLRNVVDLRPPVRGEKNGPFVPEESRLYVGAVALEDERTCIGPRGPTTPNVMRIPMPHLDLERVSERRKILRELEVMFGRKVQCGEHGKILASAPFERTDDGSVVIALHFCCDDGIALARRVMMAMMK